MTMLKEVSEQSHLNSDSLPGSRRWLGLTVLAVAQFMVVLDATIVNIALPDIGKALHMRPDGLAWIITAYVIAFGGLLPLGGRLADLLGRRRVFAIGVGVFTAASLAGGLAQDPAMLIGTRAIQGAGAALLAPAALGLVTSIFSNAAERARALSIWGAVAAGGAAAGVLLGGLLTGGLGWRSVFLINVPVGIAVLGVLRAVVAENRERATGGLSASRFDIPGAATITGGLVALVTTLSEGHAWGWGSPAVVVGLVAAAVLLTSFVIVEARASHPLVPLALLRYRTVSVGNLAMLLTGAAMIGLFYFLSLYEQLVLGYDPITSGVSQLPLAAALILAAGAAAPLMAHFGARATLATALLVFAGGLGWLSLTPAGGGFVTDLLGPTLLIGFGLGAAFVPITAIAVANVPSSHAGTAGGLVNTSQQVGGAIGLATLVAVATAGTGDPAGSGAARLAALDNGYSWAFLAAAAIAVTGAVLTAIGVHRTDAAEPATAPMGGDPQ